jgi:hypothetical protein
MSAPAASQGAIAATAGDWNLAPPSANPLREGYVLYGGFWLRVAAALIDTVILLVPWFVLRNRLGGAGPLVSSIGDWLYFALMESSYNQATLGKMACGPRRHRSRRAANLIRPRDRPLLCEDPFGATTLHRLRDGRVDATEAGSPRLRRGDTRDQALAALKGVRAARVGRPSLRRGTTPCGVASHSASSASELFLFSPGAERPTMAHEDQSPPAARGMTASMPDAD